MANVLFITAHQDDELITMGGGIVEHVMAGHNVKVVCLTKGEKSGVKNILKNNKECELQSCVHNVELTEAEFIVARDREQIKSCKELGVELIINNERLNDGQVAIEAAKSVIKNILNKYPDYRIKTHTPYGATCQHKDHKNIGLACLELHKEGYIKDLRFYVEPYELTQFKALNPNIPIATVENPLWEKRLNGAIEVYKGQDREKERYAIGYHSVKDILDKFKDKKTNYCHIPCI